MSVSRTPHAILVAPNTLFELYYLSAICLLLRQKSSALVCNLLLRDTLDAHITSELKQLYTDIDILPFPGNTDRWHNVIRRSIRFKKSVAPIIEKNDIVIISSFAEYFANIICLLARRARKRLIAPTLSYWDAADYPYKETKAHRMQNIFNRLFGYAPATYHYAHEHARDKAFKKQLAPNPYDLTIYIADNAVEPRMVRDRGVILPNPFFALKKLRNTRKTTITQPAILIIGERTPPLPDWIPEDQECLDAFVGTLRTHFPNHTLYFKPRTGLTDVAKLDLTGMVRIDEHASLEELFIHNDFDKVVSVKSTASATAAHFGYDAYFLYPAFHKTHPDTVRYLDTFFSDNKAVIRATEPGNLTKHAAPSDENADARIAGYYYDAIMGA